MEWKEVLSFAIPIACWIAVSMLFISRIEINHLKWSRDHWKKYGDEVYEMALNYGETVRKGISKEISLAIDTLDACEALTERERDILTAVSYHYDPLSKEHPDFLSNRILGFLTRRSENQ